MATQQQLQTMGLYAALMEEVKIPSRHKDGDAAATVS